MMVETKAMSELNIWIGQGSAAVLEKSRRDRLLDLREMLVTLKSRACHQFKSESGYSGEDIDILWADMMRFVEGVTDVLDSLLPTTYLSSSARTEWRPKGTILVVLPSNAPVPLVGILAAASIVSGSRIAFTSPRTVRATVELIVRNLVAVSDIHFFGETPRQLMSRENLVKFDCLYFMGSSSAYAEVASACAQTGTSLLFEGQGFTSAVVSKSARNNLVEVVEHTLRSKQFCNGRMCSAPNSIWLDQSVAADYYDCFTSLAPHYELQSELGTQELVKEVLDLEEASTLVGAADLPWTSSRSPVLFNTNRFADSLIVEFFGPMAWVGEYMDFSEVIDAIRDVRYRMQVAYFGNDQGEVSQLIQLPLSRYCLNQVPSYQDPLLPWGNSGLSGYSRLETFVEKLAEPILVEGHI